MDTPMMIYKFSELRFFDFFVIIPEIFVVFWLIVFLISFTLVTRRRFIFTSPKTQKEHVYCVNPFLPITMLLLVITIGYFMLLKNVPATYATMSGLTSTSTVYLIKLILTFVFMLYIVYIRSEKDTLQAYPFEYFIVIFFAFIFLQLMLISGSLMNLFIFLECYGLCVYYLLISKKVSDSAVEAGTKYFIIGALSSSIFLFGFYLVYYATGCNNFIDIFNLTLNNPYYYSNTSYLVGTFLISFSLLLKLGASFFFFRVVDVYRGASFHILIFLNIFPKLVYTFVLFNLIGHFNIFYLSAVVKILVISSLFFGLLGAIGELKIKRFLIYTSIYNIAFFSLPFWNFDKNFISAFLLFTLLYLLNSFLFMILLGTLKDWSSETIFKSLLDLSQVRVQSNPRAIFIMIYTFFASGLPMSGFFLAKLLLFFDLSRYGHFILLFIFLLASVLSLFYYVRIFRMVLHINKTPYLFLQPITFPIALMLSFGVWLNFLLIFLFDDVLILLNVATALSSV